MSRRRISTLSKTKKKQVICFLDLHQIEAVRQRSVDDGKTNQEIIGESLNAYLKSVGEKEVFTLGHRRLIRRNRVYWSKPREANQVSNARVNKYCLGGWFSEKEVEYAIRSIFKHSSSIQNAVEQGLGILTGVYPETKVPFPE